MEKVEFQLMQLDLILKKEVKYSQLRVWEGRDFFLPVTVNSGTLGAEGQ